jgi:transcriptional regulator with XRE-family HTH domain
MKPSDPAASPTEDPAPWLVAELNHLRGAAGMASYRKLAARTNYSRSALWRATRGSRLPSRDITLALASACGGDIAEWDRKWRTAHADTATGRIPGDEAAPTAASPASAFPEQDSPVRRPTRAWLVVVLATTIVVLGAITAVVSVSRSEASPSAAAPQPQALLTKPADGDDPYVSKCGTDQQRLEYQNVYWPDHDLYGWLELYHSHVCNASWGYVFGPNSARWQVTIVARRLPDDTVAPSSTNANDPPNSWGNVLSTPPATCVRVEAYITVGAIRGPMAVTSCQPDRPGGGVAPPPTPPPAPPPQYTASPAKQGSRNGR